MQMQFHQSGITYLEETLCELQNLEQTQELKLSDGMPDIGRVLASWGQVILRSKEWRSDSVLISGGMMVWVLYAPEDGSGERMLDGWIPFQIKWPLPDNTPEGTVCVDSRIRFVDARMISPRKIMVRAGVAALGRAFVETEQMTFLPENVPADVAVLKKPYSVMLPQEAGETAFYSDEELNGVSGSLVCYLLGPELTDKKVLGNKLAFRGNLNLHVLYTTEGGRLEAQDFLLPFSQYAELKKAYGTESEAEIVLCATNLEVERGEESRFHVKCGMTAQYRIREKTDFEVAVDAYSPCRSVTAETQELPLPVRMERGRVNLFGEAELPEGVREPVDLYFLPGYPAIERGSEKSLLESYGPAQMLYYDDQGRLRSATTRWEGRGETNASVGESRAFATQQHPELHLVSSGERTHLRGELTVETVAASEEGIRQITAIELGDDVEPDAARPSLILRRAGKNGLWELAKSCGSMVEAIREANHLEGEPTEGQMLLIPIS